MPYTRPYAAQHVDLNGPGDARPTAAQVVQDQGLVNGLKDNVILITGATSGIGIETARALYLTGARIYITARDAEKGAKVAAELSTDSTRPVKVILMSMDSLQSVRSGANDFLRQESTLNVLINNAGIMGCPYSTTIDGHETHFATNHLGHFLLFNLLIPALLAAATPTHPSRIIALSSSAHRYATYIPFHDLTYSESPYDPMHAYGVSKLANIHFANELDRRYSARNLRAFSVHPGSIRSPLQRFLKDSERYQAAIADPAYEKQVKSAEQGAATTVWAAVGRELEGRGGVYLENVGEAEMVAPEGPAFRTGYGEAAYDEAAEGRLWRVSAELCGLSREGGR